MNRSCPICDSVPLRPMTWSETFDHHGGKLDVDGLRYHRCKACGADPVLKDDLTFNHRLITNARRATDGLLTGPEIRELRQRVGLTQKQAAALFGCSEQDFGKYESSDAAQSMALDRLMRMAESFPDVLANLAAHAGVELTQGFRGRERK